MFNESKPIVSPVPSPDCGRLTRPKSRNPYGSSRRGKATLYLLFVLILIGVGIFGIMSSGKDVWLYVDNGRTEPMVVTVDGKEEATIAPGEFVTLKYQPGEKRLQVRCGDEVLFDSVKNLEKSDKIGASRRYFFNPDSHNRYATYVVKYGSSPLEGLLQSIADDSSADRKSQIRSAYRQLAAELTLLPPDPWFEVPASAHVLTSPPAFVTTRGFTERRTVMTRVDPKDYSFLEKARENKDPSAEDLGAMMEVVDRVLDSEP